MCICKEFNEIKQNELDKYFSRVVLINYLNQ